MKEIEPFDEKADFINSFKELQDGLVPVEWSGERQERVNELLADRRLNTARVATIPMICRGSACPSAGVCPLYQEGLHPLGMSCPIEMKIVVNMMLSLIEELEIDSSSMNEVGMVRDLVDQEIQQLRKQSLLAQNDIIQENVIGIDEQGEPILKKELHLAVEWEDRIHKRKAVILKQLVATREAKIKAGSTVLDQAANMAKILGEYQRISSANDEKLLNKAGMGEHHDDYIESQVLGEDEKDFDDESE